MSNYFQITIVVFAIVLPTIQALKHSKGKFKADCGNFTDLVGPLINFTKSHTQQCSYSGFAPLDEDRNNALFYWYIPNEQEKEDAPVLVWLQGGPGASSLWGAFAEHIGPWEIVDNSDDDGQSVKYTPNSWASEFNMLFIDNPLGTGYSYSANNSYSTNIDETSLNLWNAIQYFMNIHNETRSMDWYISGESFGGRFVPGLTYWILKKNDEFKGISNKTINLQGMLLGDGYVHGLGQRTTMIDQAIDTGLIAPYQVSQFHSMGVKCDNAAGTYGLSDNRTVKACNDIFSYIQNVSGVDPLASQMNANSSGEMGAPNIPYFNNPDVMNLLNVNTTKKKGDAYTQDASNSYNALIHQILNDSFVYVNDVLQKVPCLFYYGSYDIRDGSFSAPDWMELLDKPYNSIVDKPREKWLVDDKLAGYWQTYQNMTFLTVQFAGHFVPYFVRETSVSMVNTFVNRSKWGKTGIGAQMCNLMSQCSNGYGTCNKTTGICECNDGYGLEDCSLIINQMNDTANYSLSSREYALFKLKDNGSDSIISITNSKNMTVFCSYDKAVTNPKDAFAVLFPSRNAPDTRSIHLPEASDRDVFLTVQNNDLEKVSYFVISQYDANIKANFFSSTGAAVIAYGLLLVSIAAMIISISWVKKHRKKIERDNLILDPNED